MTRDFASALDLVNVYIDIFATQCLCQAHVILFVGCQQQHLPLARNKRKGIRAIIIHNGIDIRIVGGEHRVEPLKPTAVDGQLDHNFLVHRNDPIIPLLEQNNERFLALSEHPTAEVLAKLIYQHMHNNGFEVDQVVLWETASASACYREN